MKRAGAATIKQVANLAGVSVTAVSRHLNGQIALPGMTAERIEQAVVRLGYRPNANARRLSRGTSETLGIIISDIASPLFAAIASAAEEEASRLGYSLVMFNSRNESAKEIGFLSRLDDRGVDGILLLTNHPDNGELVAKINATGRVVLLDEDVPGAAAPRLFAENRDGGRLAARHLIGKGHARIGFVGGPEGLLSSRERFAGFREVMAQAGRPADPALVFFGDYDEATGMRALAHFAGLAQPPTAIFAIADVLALGILRACRSRGIRVPADLSLVGFDNFPNVDLLDPPLTTVRQSPEEFGRRGVRLLVDLIGGVAGQAEPHVSVELIVRNSVAAPANNPWPKGAAA